MGCRFHISSLKFSIEIRAPILLIDGKPAWVASAVRAVRSTEITIAVNELSLWWRWILIRDLAVIGRVIFVCKPRIVVEYYANYDVSQGSALCNLRPARQLRTAVKHCAAHEDVLIWTRNAILNLLSVLNAWANLDWTRRSEGNSKITKMFISWFCTWILKNKIMNNMGNCVAYPLILPRGVYCWNF